MSKGYNATLKNGSEIYIPMWAASEALKELSNAGKYIGSDHLIAISQLDVPSLMVAVLEAKDPENTAGLIKHYVCSVRIEGERITPNVFDEMFEGELFLAMEIFTHVIKAQYASFFELGLAKETSPNN